MINFMMLFNVLVICKCFINKHSYREDFIMLHNCLSETKSHMIWEIWMLIRIGNCVVRVYMHDAFGNVIDSNIMLRRVYKILKHNHNDMKRVDFQTMKWPCQIHARHWSQNLEKTRSQKCVPKSVGWLWNLTGVSSGRLSRRLLKFKIRGPENIWDSQIAGEVELLCALVP